MSVNITFLGGAGTVTGSKYLVEHDGQRLLVDCGLFQGYKQLRLRNWRPLPFEPRHLGAVILTSPLVPATVRWYRGRRAERGAERDTTGDKPTAAEVVSTVVTPGGVADDATGDLDMTDFELALVDTEEAPEPEPEDTSLAGLDLDDLCRLWRRTSVLLRQPLDQRRVTEVLDARQRCLDELMRRHPAATRAWLESGASRADDPRPFLDERDIGVALVRAASPLATWFRTAAGWRVELDDGLAVIAVRADDPCQIRATQ